ncbi:hypothetical protein AAULR_25541 [Lacticaseibacillus rhamnosus MTCC 5462]|nr:hypothetical protein AAULR_25541 [Lacticaseibacillus rhamnosus MTCC 5462]
MKRDWRNAKQSLGVLLIISIIIGLIVMYFKTFGWWALLVIPMICSLMLIASWLFNWLME